MTNTEANPPHWAETILQCLLKPSDRDSTVGDLLDKPRANGGFELSRYMASAVLAGFIFVAVLLLPQKAETARGET